jgi:hypothetical protein
LRFVPIDEILYLHVDILGISKSKHSQVVDNQRVRVVLIAGDRNSLNRREGGTGRDDGTSSIDVNFNGTRPSKEEMNALIRNRVEFLAAITRREVDTLVRENAIHDVPVNHLAFHIDSHRGKRP